MCELFGLCSRVPTVATISLQRFAAHSGVDHRSIDGWGLALFDGRDLRLNREPEPAYDSRWLDFIQSRRIASSLLVSHIRHATRGAVALENTQPFAREIAGRMHCFAHNGRLESHELEKAGKGARFQPVGQTDSELAACALFESMARLWSRYRPSEAAHPSLALRLQTIAGCAARLRELGPANFLYCDGLALFAHGHRRIQVDGRIAAPGLWVLHRSCPLDPDALEAAGLHIEGHGAAQQLTLVASVPLGEEHWEPLGEGECVAIEDGLLYRA